MINRLAVSDSIKNVNNEMSCNEITKCKNWRDAFNHTLTSFINIYVDHKEKIISFELVREIVSSEIKSIIVLLKIQQYLNICDIQPNVLYEAMLQLSQ